MATTIPVIAMGLGLALMAGRALGQRLRYRDALEQIRDQDWVENTLDPQWAARIAGAALTPTDSTQKGDT